MKPSADARVRARRRRKQKTRVLTITLTVAALLAVPVSLYFIDWPISLIAAIPLGVMALWLVLMQRMAK